MLFIARFVTNKNLLFIFIFGIFIACNSGNLPEEKEDLQISAEEVETEEAETEETTDEREFSYLLPSTLQIAAIFKKSGLKYISDITNDHRSVSKYTTNFSKLLNLGVYSADLCYVTLNKQAQQKIHYLKTINNLADDLGFSSILASKSLLIRFEQNEENEDSMYTLLSEFQENLDIYLEDNEQEENAVIIFSGGWVESVYLGVVACKDDVNERLNMRIKEQLSILNNLIKNLEFYKNKNDEIEGLINDLSSLKEMVENLAFMQDAGKEEGISKTSISDEELSKLASKIVEIRTKIIAG
ncbi:MAG: hypothetical protein ABII90_15280 [Bacteroidota bacterium]